MAAGARDEVALRSGLEKLGNRRGDYWRDTSEVVGAALPVFEAWPPNHPSAALPPRAVRRRDLSPTAPIRSPSPLLPAAGRRCAGTHPILLAHPTRFERVTFAFGG